MAKGRGNTVHPKEEDGLRQLPVCSNELKKLFSSSSDIIFRSALIGGNPALPVVLVFLDGLADQKIIDDNVMLPLAQSPWFDSCNTLSEAYTLSLGGALQIADITAAADLAEAVTALLSGKTLLCFDKLKSILMLNTIRYESAVSNRPKKRARSAPLRTALSNRCVSILRC